LTGKFRGPLEVWYVAESARRYGRSPLLKSPDSPVLSYLPSCCNVDLPIV
jgi:hypothetical protein